MTAPTILDDSRRKSHCDEDGCEWAALCEVDSCAVNVCHLHGQAERSYCEHMTLCAACDQDGACRVCERGAA